VALSKLAVDKFEETGRPLRIAIDTSIWLFQIQASRGEPAEFMRPLERC
jgi:Holliday junction resolvase YEN1